MQMKYINSSGKVLDMSAWPIICLNDPDVASVWQLDKSPRGRFGSLLNTATRNEQILNFTIALSGATPAELDALIEQVMNVYGEDVRAEKMGQLWAGKSYCEGLIQSYEKNKAVGKRYAEFKITFCSFSAFWITTQKVEFGIVPANSNGFRMPFRFPFGFRTAVNSNTIANPTAFPAPAIIRMFGPCIKPAVTVNGHIYQVLAEARAGERFEINQLHRTLTLVTSDGKENNAFTFRNKDYSIFEYLPPGGLEIVADNKFAYEIVLLHQRSLPKWT